MRIYLCILHVVVDSSSLCFLLFGMIIFCWLSNFLYIDNRAIVAQKCPWAVTVLILPCMFLLNHARLGVSVKERKIKTWLYCIFIHLCINSFVFSILVHRETLSRTTQSSRTMSLSQPQQESMTPQDQNVPNNITIPLSSNPPHEATPPSLDSSDTHTNTLAFPGHESTIEQIHSGYSAVPSTPPRESSEEIFLDSRPVPNSPSAPNRIDTHRAHKSAQLHQQSHAPVADLQKILARVPNPLARFPRYFLEAIFLIGNQPRGKLVLYSLVLLACCCTGTPKFGY